MNHKALVVIDIQNDITKHYRDIIDKLNEAIEWAAEKLSYHLVCDFMEPYRRVIL